eukprot:jgi/Picre1/29102/NNA_004495.t1
MIDDVRLAGRSGKVKSSVSLSILNSSKLVVLHMADFSVSEDSKIAEEKDLLRPFVHVIHAGGALQDGLIQTQSHEKIVKVFSSKIASWDKLRNATFGNGILAEVLFSSVASLIGSAGQANYSAANSLLDAIASSGQTAGIYSVSTQWGAWLGAGMAAQDTSTATRVERLGMRMIRPEEGLSLIEMLLQGNSFPSNIAAVPFLWDKLVSRLHPNVPRLFDKYVSRKEVHDAAQVSSQVLVSSLLRKKRKSKVASSRPKASISQEQMVVIVSSVVKSILGREVEPNEPLMSAGLDSLTSVEFRNSLEARVGLSLASTLVFDYPTIEAISEYT